MHRRTIFALLRYISKQNFCVTVFFPELSLGIIWKYHRRPFCQPINYCALRESQRINANLRHYQLHLIFPLYSTEWMNAISPYVRNSVKNFSIKHTDYGHVVQSVSLYLSRQKYYYTFTLMSYSTLSLDSVRTISVCGRL